MAAVEWVDGDANDVQFPPAAIVGTAIDTDLLATATTPVGVLIASLNSILIVEYLTRTLAAAVALVVVKTKLVKIATVEFIKYLIS